LLNMFLAIVDYLLEKKLNKVHIVGNIKKLVNVQRNFYKYYKHGNIINLMSDAFNQKEIEKVRHITLVPNIVLTIGIGLFMLGYFSYISMLISGYILIILLFTYLCRRYYKKLRYKLKNSSIGKDEKIITYIENGEYLSQNNYQSKFENEIIGDYTQYNKLQEKMFVFQKLYSQVVTVIHTIFIFCSFISCFLLKLDLSQYFVIITIDQLFFQNFINCLVFYLDYDTINITKDRLSVLNSYSKTYLGDEVTRIQYYGDIKYKSFVFEGVLDLSKIEINNGIMLDEYSYYSSKNTYIKEATIIENIRQFTTSKLLSIDHQLNFNKSIYKDNISKHQKFIIDYYRAMDFPLSIIEIDSLTYHKYNSLYNSLLAKYPRFMILVVREP